MSLNIGKETLVGRILGKNDRDNRVGFNDLNEMYLAFGQLDEKSLFENKEKFISRLSDMSKKLVNLEEKM